MLNEITSAAWTALGKCANPTVESARPQKAVVVLFIAVGIPTGIWLNRGKFSITNSIFPTNGIMEKGGEVTPARSKANARPEALAQEGECGTWARAFHGGSLAVLGRRS